MSQLSKYIYYVRGCASLSIQCATSTAFSPLPRAFLLALLDPSLIASPLLKKKNGIGAITQAISANNKPAHWKCIFCQSKDVSGVRTTTTVQSA